MIKNSFVKYLQKITFFSIIVCFCVMFLWLFVEPDYIRTAPYYIIMYYVVTLGCWCFLNYAPKRGIVKFEQAYMITKIAKLFIYILVFVAVLLFGWEKNVKFAFAFLILYVVYMIFDTVTVMQLLKQNKKDKK